jgi:glycosyltransferase involved in cell wall biosynthesis
MKPLLLVTGPVATRSGYGSHSRDLVRSLIAMDRFDIKINSMRWGNCPLNALSANDIEDKKIIDLILTEQKLEKQPEIHIHISVPNEFQPIGKYNIGITAGIENTLPKPEWIEGLNRMDLNLVPSKFVKDGFEKVEYEKIDEKSKQKVGIVKLTKPMEVLFEGTDTSIYKKTNKFSEYLLEKMDKVENDWNFLFVGHWLQGNFGHDRKDLSMLIKVFLETFKNQKNAPGLILKTSGATFSVTDRKQMIDKINMIKDDVGRDSILPNIYLLHGDLEDEEMNGLYNHPKVKAHITFTHGEGFGRPLLEASMSEKPVVAPAWSGHVDFLNKQHSVLLPGVLTDVHESSLPKEMLVKGAQWFTVNYQQAARYINDIFRNYKKYASPSKKQTIANKSKFSLDAMTVEFSSILDNRLPKFEEQPQAVSLNLPKLKKVGKPNKMKLPKLKKV